jgi:DNA-binding transcriptional MocR family regulator
MQEPFPFKAAARLIDFMRQADQPGLINLAAGVPGLDALPVNALHTATEAAFAKDGAAMFAYHHPEGDRELRELLAERLKARGVPGLKGDEIVTVTGCTQALQGMLSVLVKPGDIVACEAPAYYGLLELIAEAQARILPIPLRGAAGIDLDAAEELLARWKPKCLVVCTALSNPSGATVPEKDRERLVQICRKNGVRLIEDDLYAELEDAGAATPCLAHDDGSTVSLVSSFSKTVSPGLRVGFAVPGSAYHDAFASKKCQQDLHSAVVTEVILRHFIIQGSLEPHLAWLRKRNEGRRALVLDAIQRHFPESTKINPPTGGYMLWAELPAHVEMTSLRDAARAEGVVFAAGQVFFAAPPGGAGSANFVRLNCAKASEAALERGIEVLGRLMKA